MPLLVLIVPQSTRGLGHGLCEEATSESTTWPTRGLGHRLFSDSWVLYIEHAPPERITVRIKGGNLAVLAGDRSPPAPPAWFPNAVSSASPLWRPALIGVHFYCYLNFIIVY